MKKDMADNCRYDEYESYVGPADSPFYVEADYALELLATKGEEAKEEFLQRLSPEERQVTEKTIAELLIWSLIEHNGRTREEMVDQLVTAHGLDREHAIRLVGRSAPFKM